MGSFAELGFEMEFSGLDLRVAGFRGWSGLNRLYAVTVRCLADAAKFSGVGARGVLGAGATLKIRAPRGGADAGEGRTAAAGVPSAELGRWPGTVVGLRVIGRAASLVALDMTIAPGMALMAGRVGNSIHLDRSGPEAVLECLGQAGLSCAQVRLETDRAAYPAREFAFRRDEDPLRFVMRILERDGVGLRFDMTGAAETAVLLDSNSGYPALRAGGKEAELHVTGVSGLPEPGAAGALYGVSREIRVPRAAARVRDFDFMNPGRALEAVAEICPWGRGETYLYGENVTSSAEAARLARCVGDAELWASDRVTGTSHLPGFQAGVTVTLAGSPGGSLDGRYLVEAQEMEGSQLGSLGFPAGAAPGTGEAGAVLELLGGGMPDRPSLPFVRTGHGHSAEFGPPWSCGPSGEFGLSGTSRTIGTGGEFCRGWPCGASGGGPEGDAGAAGRDGFWPDAPGDGTCHPFRDHLADFPDGWPGAFGTAADNGGTEAAFAGAALAGDAPHGGRTRSPDDPAEGAVRHRILLGRLERPYRPLRRVPRPAASGAVSAWIDGAGSGDVPETDSLGRYKVIFPPDLSGRAQGRASHWIRMAQPSVGTGYGQNFPLAPGCEVLVTFTGGDPDRPLIAGAMPNAESGNFVNSASPTGAGVGTRGGSSLMFAERKDGSDTVISTGSGRGHLALHAGSPTFSVIHADIVSQLNSIANSTSVFTSTLKSGYFHKIKASGKWTTDFLTNLMALRELGETGSDVAASMAASGDFCESVRGRAAIVADAFAMADFAAAPAKTFYQMLRDFKTETAEVDLRGPADNNVFRLTTDEDGAVGTWRSSASSVSSTSTWDDVATFITQFLMIMKPLRDGVSGFRDVDAGVTDQAHAKDKEDGAARPGTGTTRPTEASKTSLKWRVGGSAVCKVVSDVLTTVNLIRQMLGIKGEVAGVRIENRDSYVSIDSSEFGVMSSRGPLLLESAPGRVGEDLHFVSVRDRSIVRSLAMDADGVVPVDFGKQEVALLRGRLIRTLSAELDLAATRKVALESPGPVRLATGDNRAVQGLKEGRGKDEALKDLVVLKAGPPLAKGVTIEVSPEEDYPGAPVGPPPLDAFPGPELPVPEPPTDEALAALASDGADEAVPEIPDVWSAVPAPPPPPPAQPAGPPVARMLAKSDSGAVTLLHGTFSDDSAKPENWKDGGRRLVLFSGGTILQDDVHRNLVMSADTGTKLSGAARLSLTLKDGVSTLEAEEGNALSVDAGGDMDIKVQQELDLSAGEGILTLSSTDLKIDHRKTIDISGKFMKLGD
ncbi:MAG: phage baseplate assembly protein V [Deltaproteobacteria bacterium]|jgi:uncharacterized protein involved in type VI secretion and phage assembly|nr:phage baseplate assembly protein V [Deltaproteobacteria bacterium]